MKTSPAPKTLSLPRPVMSKANASPKASAIPQLQPRSQEAAALLKALANPERLLLLCIDPFF